MINILICPHIPNHIITSSQGIFFLSCSLGSTASNVSSDNRDLEVEFVLFRDCISSDDGLTDVPLRFC